jgi:hypothetical protein
MLQERTTAIENELMEVATLPELKAIWCNWQAEALDVASDPLCSLMLRSTLTRLRLFPVEQAPEQSMTGVPAEQRLEELLAKLAKVRAAAKPVVRAGRKYKLLKTEVDWSTKPQVHAVMHILSAHLKPGEVADEADIVRMMVENEVILETRQGGKRIWDYYKGDHHEGLVAHGNIQRM